MHSWKAGTWHRSRRPGSRHIHVPLPNGQGTKEGLLGAGLGKQVSLRTGGPSSVARGMVGLPALELAQAAFAYFSSELNLKARPRGSADGGCALAQDLQLRARHYKVLQSKVDCRYGAEALTWLKDARILQNGNHNMAKLGLCLFNSAEYICMGTSTRGQTGPTACRRWAHARVIDRTI